MAFQGKPVIGLVPARGGSKGIARKNLASLGGRPLVAYAIQAGQGAGVVDRVVVTSEDAEIRTVAARLGADVIDRPAALATDDAGSDGVIAQAIDALGLPGDAWIVLLQPTSPLRTAGHIDAVFARIDDAGAGGAISVLEPAHHPMKAYVVDGDGHLTGMVGPDAPYRPRQSLPVAYLPNGALYVFMVNAFLKDGRIPSDRMIPFVMTAEDSIDIDTPADIARAEAALARRPQERQEKAQEKAS